MKMPFGKYKGKELAEVAYDQKYVSWLGDQPWVREQFPAILKALQDSEVRGNQVNQVSNAVDGVSFVLAVLAAAKGLGGDVAMGVAGALLALAIFATYREQTKKKG